MQTFCLAVWNYDALVLMVKTSAEKIPAQGDEIEINFASPGTEFIEGEWGREAATGSYSFTVTGTAAECNGLPVVGSQLAYEDEEAYDE